MMMSLLVVLFCSAFNKPPAPAGDPEREGSLAKPSVSAGNVTALTVGGFGQTWRSQPDPRAVHTRR
jgi:hypothetical protein